MTDKPIETLPDSGGPPLAPHLRRRRPEPGSTGPILETLIELGVQATFFVVGQEAQAPHPSSATGCRRRDGVGVHTWDHLDLVGRDTKLVADELGWTIDLLTDLGCPPELFRPPYGAWDQRTMDVAAALGLASVTWSIDTDDWKCRGVDSIVRRVRDEVAPGSICTPRDARAPTRRSPSHGWWLPFMRRG